MFIKSSLRKSQPAARTQSNIRRSQKALKASSRDWVKARETAPGQVVYLIGLECSTRCYDQSKTELKKS